MKSVELTPCESAVARYIGRQRNSLSLKTKMNGRRDPNQSDEQMNVEAVGAELAVAKVLNLYPDLSPTSGELPSCDLIFKKCKIEIKRNHLPNGDLLVPRLNENLLYVLVCGQIPCYTIAVYIQGKDIPLKGRWAELTYGPCWKVPPQQLNPV